MCRGEPAVSWFWRVIKVCLAAAEWGGRQEWLGGLEAWGKGGGGAGKRKILGGRDRKREGELMHGGGHKGALRNEQLFVGLVGVQQASHLPPSPQSHFTPHSIPPCFIVSFWFLVHFSTFYRNFRFRFQTQSAAISKNNSQNEPCPIGIFSCVIQKEKRWPVIVSQVLQY